MTGNPPQQVATLAFMTLVTGCLLALVFERAATGPASLMDVVVYALTAGFGLEFLISSWPLVARAKLR